MNYNLINQAKFIFEYYRKQCMYSYLFTETNAKFGDGLVAQLIRNGVAANHVWYFGNEK